MKEEIVRFDLDENPTMRELLDAASRFEQLSYHELSPDQVAILHLKRAIDVKPPHPPGGSNPSPMCFICAAHS